MSSLWRYFLNFFRGKATHLSEAPLLTKLKYQKVLGEGGYGIVLKAIGPTTKEETSTAVKFLFPIDPNDLKLTARECEITKNLQKHANIVQVLAFVATKLRMTELVPIFRDCSLRRYPKALTKYLDEYDDPSMVNTICIQQELCGENLRNWLNNPDYNNRQDPSFQNVQITIIKNLIAGLKYLHDNKIIHRDLNPNNVMFSGENFELPVKIGDFGLCRVIHSSEESQSSALTPNIGTRVYQAPEVSCGKYSYQADLFSLGLVMWEVAQLIRLADREGLLHQYFDQDKANVVEDHPLIPGVRELIINLTKKKVEDRIQSVDHVVRICESWEEHVFSVKTAEELTFWLQNIRPGCKISLWDGVYEGNFVLKTDNVEIVGQGGGTILLCKEKNGTCLEIVGNGCTVSGIKIGASQANKGIKIRGRQNTISDMEFVGGNESLSVAGDENDLSNLTISHANCGLTINGCKNNIKGIKLEEIGLWGINIVSNSRHNNLACITGKQLKIGILLAGSNNHVSDINFEMENEVFRVVRPRVPTDNTIQLCSGGGSYPRLFYRKEKENESFTTYLLSDASTLVNADSYEKVDLGFITKILPMYDSSVSILGDENIVDNLDVSNGKNGLVVEGGGNVIQNVNLKNGRGGISVEGSNHTLANINFTTTTNFKKYKSNTWLNLLADNTTLKESKCEGVAIYGTNTSLTDVKCGKLTIWDRARNISLVKCSSKTLKTTKYVTTTDCKFKKII